jgi:hypothetical protein
MKNSILIISSFIFFTVRLINVFFYGKSRQVEDGGGCCVFSQARGCCLCYLIPAFYFAAFTPTCVLSIAFQRGFWVNEMKKTWFQHDFNCSKKDGFAMLLARKNGDALYGKFWLLQEHFYTVQQNKCEFKNTVIITERDYKKVIRVNGRSLGNVLETFLECLGIVSETFQKRFGNVYKVTIPKSLIYLRRRNLKKPNKMLDIYKEEEKNIFLLSGKEKEIEDGLGSMGSESRELAGKIAKKIAPKVKDVSAV